MTGELGKVDRARARARGRPAQGLRRAEQRAAPPARGHRTRSREHTQQLREALASSKARGQWGERMAEDVLRLAGLLEGVNYRKQAHARGSRGRPDYTFLLPNGLVHAHGREVPARQLRALPRSRPTTSSASSYRDQFLRDVRDRVKELTTRGYLDAADDTVDCLLLFIPNEQVYAFVQEHDRDASSTTRCAHKIVLCSPLTLYAVLAVVRQAVDNFQLERTSNEILGLLGEFSLQWEKYVDAARQGAAALRGGRQGVRGADDARGTARCSARSTRSSTLRHEEHGARSTPTITPLRARS